MNVSVVIPTYNGASFIRETLSSISTQTCLPREIIVVDDASTDDTITMVRTWAAESSIALKLIQLPRNSGGPAYPTNTGIDIAREELIILLDHDDLMAPERIELSLAAARRHPECGLVIGLVTTFEGDEADWSSTRALPLEMMTYVRAPSEPFVVPSTCAFRNLIRRNFIQSNSNLLLRKTLWKKLGGYRPDWRTNTDVDFELQAVMSTPIAIVPTVLCAHRMHPASLSHSCRQASILDGLLIRLMWGSRRLSWVDDAMPRIYSALVSCCFDLVREGRLIKAAQVSILLAIKLPFWRYVLFVLLWRPCYRAVSQRGAK
jgi:glycosyltransferase involved in cell wall biosynthesis